MRPDDPLTEDVIERILRRLPGLTVGVLGDLFLDRYLDIDAALTEPSLETGLDAYQVTRVRSCPGAAGTVVNNLAALGVGRIYPISLIGDDGEGYELRQALAAIGVEAGSGVRVGEGRRTPTYTKPMLHRAGEPPRELNRLDIKNRTPLPPAAEDLLSKALADAWDRLDALVVLDQVSEADCGVVTARVRERLATLAGRRPALFVLADSRERIGLFRSVALKPNRRECLLATGEQDLSGAVARLARLAGRPVFCTCGEEGMLLADPERDDAAPARIAGYAVDGPTDPVGAGDSTSAGIVCAGGGRDGGTGGGLRLSGGVDHRPTNRHDRHGHAGTGPPTAPRTRVRRGGHNPFQESVAAHRRTVVESTQPGGATVSTDADSMSIKFLCSHCKKVLSVKDQLAGKRGKCPHCGTVVLVPVPGKPASAPTAIRPAQPPAASPPPPLPRRPRTSTPWPRRRWPMSRRPTARRRRRPRSISSAPCAARSCTCPWSWPASGNPARSANASSGFLNRRKKIPRTGDRSTRVCRPPPAARKRRRRRGRGVPRPAPPWSAARRCTTPGRSRRPRRC